MAGKPPAADGADSTHHVAVTGFHDGAGFWSSGDRTKLQHLASDIMRRYRCKVYIETRPTLPPRLAKDQDLHDHVVADRLFSAWANPRSADVSGKDCLNINIFACSEIHMFGVRVNWPTPGRTWTKEEEALANKLNVGVNQRLAGKFGPGMADTLAFVRDTLEGNRALVARAPVGSTAPATADPHPSPETREDFVRERQQRERLIREQQQRAEQAARNGAGDRQANDFRAAAKAAGLSDADVTTVLASRGSVSYETLTEFINDQVKEGRKGKDLKDDLTTFLKFLKEKK